MWVFRPKYIWSTGISNWTNTGEYEIGFFDMGSKLFVSIYNISSLSEAEKKVHYLNGGN